MRILMVNKFYPPHIGGVETVVAQYAGAARNAGHVVEVLTCHSRKGIPTQIEEVDGVRVTRCRNWGTVWSMPVAPELLLRYLALYRKFELVHFHEPFPLGTLAALLTFGTSFAITWHSDVVRQRFVKPLVRALQWLACWRAALLTTTSQALADNSAVLSRFADKVRVMPLSVSLPAPGHMPPALVSPPYCLYLGRLASYKGLPTLVSALKWVRFGGAKLVIAGSGPLRGWLATELKARSEHVVLLDRYLSDAEKAALLAHCLFLVLPSTERSEAFGIVQLEAMARGKPVINTNLPTGVPWVSPHGQTGLTVEPSDPQALATAIQSLLDDARTRDSFGAAAVQRVRIHFCDELVLGQLLRAYEGCTAK
jgi:rhamnosyl/mannosyltransferase